MLGFIFTLGLHDDCYQLQVDFCHSKLVKMPEQKTPPKFMKVTKAHLHNAVYNSFTDLAGGNNRTCVGTDTVYEPLD